MFAVGPHTFSTNDARVLLREFDEMWELLVRDRNASVVADLRKPVDAAIAGLDVAAADDAALRSPVELAWQALLAAGPALRAAGELPGRHEGVVAQLARGGGGVPKLPVDQVSVGFRGVEGDVQANRTHHGRPFQALCLWSTEVIDAFRADGHPIHPGAAGENITISGIDWPVVTAGVRLRIGTVLCEISCPATPCSQNAQWFLGGDFRLMHEDRGPIARMYATVLEPGSIRVGDEVILEP